MKKNISVILVIMRQRYNIIYYMLWVVVGGVGGWFGGRDFCYRYMIILLIVFSFVVVLRKRERYGSIFFKMNSIIFGFLFFRIIFEVIFFIVMKSFFLFQFDFIVIIQRYTGIYYLKFGVVFGYYFVVVVGRQYLNIFCLDFLKFVCFIFFYRIYF